MRKITFPCFVFAVLIATLSNITTALAEDQQAAVRKKLESRYALTQPTAANDDIVTAGAVLTLKMSKVSMSPVSNTSFCQNTFQGGQIGQNALCKGAKLSKMWKRIPGVPTTPDAPQTRDFVKGEKVWVTKIEVRSDTIVFTLFTDAYNEVRYRASMVFPLNGTPLTPEDAAKLVGEVFDAKLPENADDSQGQQSGAADKQQSAAKGGPSTPDPPAVIPPPPPPRTDEPVAPPTTTSLGQTTAQVSANLGKPDKIDKHGTTQIYHYPNLTVTFVGGKVTAVE
jgi:hypothetical protein